MARRILVVDDDRAMVETLCDILSLDGWETFRAHDGAAAVEVAARESPDVVLMDVRMPQMNGVDALRAMKRRTPGVRVVLMTAFAAAELLAQAERDGVVSILKKPVDLPELLALLGTAATRNAPVLVVDDDPDTLAAIRDGLARHGVVCITARTADEAVAELERSAPGAILLGSRIPGVDAREQLVAFHTLSPSSLLILFSSQQTDIEATMRAVPPGLVSATFTKPLPIERLLEVIRDTPGR
jgi:DNA-binding NtrC family response regulator